MLLAVCALACAACGADQGAVAASAAAVIAQTRTAAPTAALTATPEVPVAVAIAAALTETQAAAPPPTASASASATASPVPPSATPSPTATASATPSATTSPTLRPVSVPSVTPTPSASPLPAIGTGSFTFSGQVVYRTAPLPGAVVTVRMLEGGTELSAVTDAAGQFVISGVLSGRFVYGAVSGDLRSWTFEGDQMRRCNAYGLSPNAYTPHQCVIEAGPNDHAAVTMYMAQQGLVQWKQATRDATNIGAMGDVSWEAVPGAAEYRFFTSGQFAGGYAEYVNRFVHETFVVTKGLYDQQTVPGQCYYIEVSAYGVGAVREPWGFSTLTLCR